MEGELVLDEFEQFFAPVSSDMVDGLIGQYQNMRGRIDTVASFVADAVNGAAIGYFIDGNVDRERGAVMSGMSQSAK